MTLFPFWSRISAQTKARWGQSAARIFTSVCVISAIIMALYMLGERFNHLSNGLTYDELYSAVTAAPHLSFKFIWQNMLLKDVNLPLFNILLFGWNRVFPFTPYWMHFFSALTGAFAVLAAWLFAPTYWTKLKKCIFVTLFSCSFILVAYGSIARTYSLAVLCTTIFSLLALEFIHGFAQQKSPAVWAWLTFFIAGLAGSYSHYFCAGLFFITALVVFLYACYYKVGRAWSFVGTAIVFGIWSFWLVHTLRIMFAPTGSWWFRTPLAKATFDMINFLFGPRWLFAGILYGSVLALVSLIFTYRKSLWKQIDFVLPMAQIILLVAVVAVVSLKFNLWLDRYFLPMLVSLILLFAEFLDHLRKRHIVLLVLWPVFLAAWTSFYWRLDYLTAPEYTGLREAFNYLVRHREIEKVLIDVDGTGYPFEGLMQMFYFHIPQGRKLELIPLTPENVSLSWTTNPRTYIFMPLCSQVHMFNTSVKTRSEEDADTIMVFNHDTCIYTAHPIPRWRPRNEKENLLSF